MSCLNKKYGGRRIPKEFEPPIYLKPNDIVEITATGLGGLRNGVEDEKMDVL